VELRVVEAYSGASWATSEIQSTCPHISDIPFRAAYLIVIASLLTAFQRQLPTWSERYQLPQKAFEGI
jgi:hypothetical protein